MDTKGSILEMLHKRVNETLDVLTQLDDDPQKVSDKKWQYHEGYYYGLLDSIAIIENRCDVCDEPEGTPHCSCGQCDCGDK